MHNYIAWQLLKTRVVLTLLYLEISFRVGIPALALVMWFEDLTHIPLLYIQKQNSKMEKENFFIIKLCREHGEVTRISVWLIHRKNVFLD